MASRTKEGVCWGWRAGLLPSEGVEDMKPCSVAVGNDDGIQESYKAAASGEHKYLKESITSEAVLTSLHYIVGPWLTRWPTSASPARARGPFTRPC